VPTYQYSCTECGHFFEIFQSFSDDSLTVCPECEGRLRKVFNAVGVVFKGSGFYRNDSRGQQTGADAPAAPKEPAAAKDSTPAPAKTEKSASSGSAAASPA
jgi:putative FmdB family regulatory protein